MLFKILFLNVLFSSSAFASEFVATAPTPSKRSYQPFSVTLTQKDISSIKGGNKDREKFENDMGAFEIRIPKQNFPVPAPNCKKEIILRMPGSYAEDSTIKEDIEAKWKIFQDVKQVKAGNYKDLKVTVTPLHYVTDRADGTMELEYCNVFFFFPKKPKNAPAQK